MRVLLSAYACEPGRGSEPEAGFRTLLACAERHEVWLLTRQNNIPLLERALANHPFRQRIHLQGMDLGPRMLSLKRTAPGGLHLYYDRWQKAAGGFAAQLHGQVRFDVGHHVTFAAYWTRFGIADLPIPLVIGPIGGGVRTPGMLLSLLGVRGLVDEFVRLVTRTLVFRLTSARTAVQNARVVLVQNPETALRLGLADTTRILPNALSLDHVGHPYGAPSRTNEIAFVGRLIAWKAGVLAVRVMSLLADKTVTLHIYGEGPQRRRIERVAGRRKLGDRVIFHGHIEREALKNYVARSMVLIHPALREEAGFAVAEALSEGTPVVCLAHGGPPLLLGAWPDIPSASLRPSSPKRTAKALAKAIEGLGMEEHHEVSTGVPVRRYEAAVLDAYEDAVRERNGHVGGADRDASVP